MNRVDFSKKFTKATADYKESLDRTNRAHDAEIKRIKANHETVQKNQRDNFDDARAKLQRNFEDRVETISKDTRESLADKSKAYNEKLYSERERFIDDRAKTNEDFSKRMSELSSNYKNNQAAKDNIYNDRMNFTKENYQKSLEQKQDNFNKSLGEFRKASDDGLKDTREAYNDKLREISKNNSDNISRTQIDNNKRMGQLREHYSSALKQSELNHKSRMAELTGNNDDQRSAQINFFTKERKSIQDSFEKDIKRQRVASDKALNDAKETFNKKLNEVKQDNFKNDRFKTIKHNEQVTRIKDGYKNLIDNERQIASDRADLDRKSYEQRFAKMGKEYNQNIDKVRGRSIGAGSSLAKEFQDKKTELVNKHSKDMQRVVAENTKQNNLFKTKINEDVEKLRKAQQSDLSNTREIAKRNFEAMRKSQDLQIKENYNMFSEMNQNLVDKTAANNSKLNRQIAQRVSDLNTKYTKDMRDYKRKLASVTKGGDAFSQIREEQEQSTEKKLYERKVEQFKKEIESVEADFKHQNKEMHRKFEKDLTNKTQRYATELGDVKNENNINRLQDRIEMKKKIDTAERKFEEKSRIESQDFETEMRAQERGSKEKITKLKQNFNRTYKDLNHKNELHVQEIKDDFARDKKVFMSAITKQTEDEKYRMRKDFDIKLNKIITSYERELDKLRSDNSMIKRQMEDEINLARQKAQKLISTEKEAMSRKSREDMKLAKDEKDKRERELVSQIDRIHDTYGKKLSEQNYQSNLKLETLTREYEFKMDKIKKEAAATVALKESQISKEEQRLKTAFESEKRRIVEQYENQIASMRTSHRDQLNRLADYKSAELSGNA